MFDLQRKFGRRPMLDADGSFHQIVLSRLIER
jgi:hypothetical protein